MFSSLLPPPKHSAYDPSLHFTPQKSQIKNDKSIIEFKEVATNTNSSTQNSLDSTIPLKQKYPNLVHNFPIPPKSQQLIDETKTVLTNLLNSKLGITTNSNEPEIIQTSASSSSQPQIIQISTFEQDPMLPPKHKLRKNRHEKIEIDQEPILKKQHNVTKEERIKWNIPAAVSNWKNNNGYTIDLKKRMTSSNPATTETEINLKKFSDLNSALDQADAQVRKQLTEKAERQKALELEESKKREDRIRAIAYNSKRRNINDYDDDKYKRRKY
ncbi:PRP45 [Candida pseudojiufengensis]|uniref:PRP45 n=1 Tax=Candida pseudojiufengensis TaxID=497109 RepID=UPI002225596A|nr:PRP45 [Candida pseudojiufengensis]KAI5963096.1 PRP45 [Candida pseudojiufengensis]